MVEDRDKRDQHREDDDAELEAEAERFGREIAGGRSERKSKEDRGPVEQLAPRGRDGANRKRVLARVPNRKCRSQRDSEGDRADIEADLERVGQKVGDLRADDTDKNDRQPIDPGNVARRAELQGQCSDQ